MDTSLIAVIGLGSIGLGMLILIGGLLGLLYVAAEEWLVRKPAPARTKRRDRAEGVAESRRAA